ncbi:MAG TPA: IS701 family transposase [Actinocrinis sp.]|nr:IS701 family transposase [Actinocrinis sp.]
MKNSNTARPVGAGDALSDYCGLLFSSLARSDQRHWAEVYIRGLLITPGRKSLAAISELTLGHREIQSLQQFVNQSTWDHAAVRASLGALAAAANRPRAWAVEETAFPKNGDHSVGVARQFAHAAGRTLNCQLALSLTLVGEDTDIPLDWRLMLPECWDGDRARRAKAHLPERERHQPRWRHVLDLMDELIEDWHLPSAPVLLDGSAEQDIEPLLAGLEARGLGYIVDVGPGTVVRPAAGGALGRGLSAAQCVHGGMYKGDRTTVSWAEGADGATRQSQFLTVPVPGVAPAADARGHRAPAQRVRLVLAEWPAGRSRARGYWVTNLAARTPAHIVALAKLRSRTRAAVENLHADFGLGDFEGRSFRGWHHHVTLVSAAAAFSRVSPPMPGRTPRERAAAAPPELTQLIARPDAVSPLHRETAATAPEWSLA